ncbi:antiviral reverse transcriptase Drt3a [Flagellimonas meridianipacifica]|uniref:Reverse transcriptase (RNA-dependent DNA polymerase) n=1 Tax=Flagellimonas meridianipacifica TaxID=1080225 RepID=A0A2T0MCR7_9FLAO|nr:antiviral reverse transcriptase Drt3a [Allomuricauda pacifica]PRX55269.1 reverse transcriptase (RNA-dependent DNA polymerase) [Allomuricauda pacifica]
MLDQSFSSKSFQEIFDKENRKGINVEDKYKDDFADSIAKVGDLKILRKQIQLEKNFETRKLLYVEKKKLKKERDNLVSDVLDKIADGINTHTINLELGGYHGGQSYMFERNVQNFFISKKIQDNIKETYNVKQSSRYAILSELLNLLEDNFPKYVIRTDIKSFYESIPQKKLLDKINHDYLLSIKTKKFISQIFTSYNNLTGQTDPETAKGVPRGVGISAYLSELFMRSVDNKIRELDDLVYYARYVDDIVAIFVPKSKKIEPIELTNYKTKLTNLIISEGLVLNIRKTSEYDLLEGIYNLRFNDNQPNYSPKTIQYLGYEIGSIITYKPNGNIKSKDLSVRLSKKKVDKYFKKIKLSFQHFEKKKKHNRKNAFKLLSARINYLTSNTKLRNNKDKVFVGIYYSNPFLNNYASLEKLQTRLKWHINRAGLTTDEKHTMLKYSFTEGFTKKAFQMLPLKNKKYKSHNRKRNDVNNQNNKGILQFGIAEINSIWKR